MDEQSVIRPQLKAKEDFKIENKVFISGGGPVGLMLAIGLSKMGAKVILAEKNINKTSDNSFDARVLALTYGSKLILEGLNLWEQLKPFVTDIKSVHVSQQGFLGLTHLHATEMEVEALGYSITASDLGRVLWQKVKEDSSIKILAPASLESIKMRKNKAKVSVLIAGEIQEFKVSLVVGADGTDSKVRQLLDLAIEEKDYNSFGVIAKISTEQSPNNWAYERFTKDGPVALLPMGGKLSKAVLICPSSKVDKIKSLDSEGFIKLFSSKMGERLGAFTEVSERTFYPLKETYAPQMIKDRALLIGNASHTQHPVAAQGLNLGIADIQAFLTLAEELKITDLGEIEFLQSYAKQRRDPHQKIMGLTDSLIEVFQAKSPVIGHMRGLGLMAMHGCSSLRKRFSKLSMGVSS